MKRGRGISWVLASAAMGCSLADPPSEYFDPSGDLVTLSLAPATIDALEITEDSVIFAAGSGLFRVPKAGGAAALIAEIGQSRLTRLRGDRRGTVAYCESGAGVRVYSDLGKLTTLPETEACEDVALGAKRFVVSLVGTRPNGNINRSYRFYDHEGRPLGSAPTELDIPTSSGIRLAFAGDEAVFLAVSNGFARLCDGDECGPTTRSTLCALSSRLIGVVDSIEVAKSAKGAHFVLVATDVRSSVFEVAAPPSCLPLTSFVPGLGVEAYTSVAAPPRTTALGAEYAYRLDEGTLYRTAFGAHDTDAERVRENLGTDLRLLAIDSSAAFFVDGSRVQRLALH